MIAIKGVIRKITQVTPQDIEKKDRDGRIGFFGELMTAFTLCKPISRGGKTYKCILMVKFGKPNEQEKSRKNPDWKKEIDLIATNTEPTDEMPYHVSEDDLKIEVKTQEGILKYGNVVLEDVIRRKTNSIVTEEDGWFRTTESDWLIFVQNWEEMDYRELDQEQWQNFNNACATYNLESICISILIPAFAIKVSDMRDYVERHRGDKRYCNHKTVKDKKDKRKEADCLMIPVEKLLAENICEVYLMNPCKSKNLYEGYGTFHEDIYQLINYTIDKKTPAHYRGVVKEQIETTLKNMTIQSVLPSNHPSITFDINNCTLFLFTQ